MSARNCMPMRSDTFTDFCSPRFRLLRFCARKVLREMVQANGLPPHRLLSAKVLFTMKRTWSGVVTAPVVLLTNVVALVYRPAESNGAFGLPAIGRQESCPMKLSAKLVS